MPDGRICMKIKKLETDIILLQETHSRPEFEVNWTSSTSRIQIANETIWPQEL